MVNSREHFFNIGINSLIVIIQNYVYREVAVCQRCRNKKMMCYKDLRSYNFWSEAFYYSFLEMG